MRIAVVAILLAAAVPAWRVRHRIPIPSRSSLLPALGSLWPAPPVAPPETSETAGSAGSAKAEAHPAETAADPANSIAAAATTSARENRLATHISSDVAPLPITEPTPSVGSDSATPAIESPAVETAPADEPVPHTVRVEVALLEAKIFPPPPAARASSAVSTSASHVYGDADANVTPPEVIGGITKQLGGIVGAIEPGTTVTIEFVVNELGLVESAKALKEPRTVGESLLLATGLHAIKSWRVRPAQ
jgi:hypothetical protein